MRPWMRSAVLLWPLILTLGCSMITEPPPESLVKAAECSEQSPYISQLHIAIQSEAPLPNYLSAIVNTVVVDECVIGSPNRYVFKRHDDYNATLILYSWGESPFTQTFFEANGTPYIGALLDAKITGRPECDSDRIELREVQRPITWTHVDAVDSCGGKQGYIGF